MKKLNLSTAFLQMFAAITEGEAKYTPTDIAVAVTILHGLNAKAWQGPYVTTITYLAWKTNAKAINVRQALKRMVTSRLFRLKPVATAENTDDTGAVILTNRTKLNLTLGTIFDDYKIFNAIQYNQQSTKLQALDFTGGGA